MLPQIAESEWDKEKRERDTLHGHDKSTIAATQHQSGPAKEAAAAPPLQKGVMVSVTLG